MIEVKVLQPEPAVDYGQMVAEDPWNLVYATIPYQHFLSNVVVGQPLWFVAYEEGHVRGALPCFRAEQPGLGVVINSLPWYGSHGGCTLAPSAGARVRRALVQAYAETVSGAEVLSATLILTPHENPHVEEYWQVLKPTLTDHRIGQITALPEAGPDVERRLEATFSQKTRNLVRKSLKQGFVPVTNDEDWAWSFLHETHVANIKAVGGKAKRWDHFLALRKYLPAEWRRVWVATFEGKPIAALLLLYFNRTVEYFTPAIVHEYRPLQPLSFLIWHAILDAIGSGYRWWNWGGTWTSQKTLHHFKAGWGAEDRPYTYLINVGVRGLAWLEAKQDELQAAFPYYYTHPYKLKGSLS